MQSNTEPAPLSVGLTLCGEGVVIPPDASIMLELNGVSAGAFVINSTRSHKSLTGDSLFLALDAAPGIASPAKLAPHVDDDFIAPRAEPSQYPLPLWGEDADDSASKRPLRRTGYHRHPHGAPVQVSQRLRAFMKVLAGQHAAGNCARVQAFANESHIGVATILRVGTSKHPKYETMGRHSHERAYATMKRWKTNNT